LWMWGPGLILSITGICAVLGVQFHMPVGTSLLSVFLAFFVSLLIIHCNGLTGLSKAYRPFTFGDMVIMMDRHHSDDRGGECFPDNSWWRDERPALGDI
jgi:hypothetical protein